MISQTLTQSQTQEIKYPVINQVINKAWNFPLEAYSSEIYKKFTIVIDILEEIKTFAENFFATILELQEIKYLKDFAFSILSKISKNIKKIATIFKFILLPKVSGKIKKNIKKKNKAVKHKNANDIFDAKLKTLGLIGKCLKIPKAIHSFLDLTLGEKAPQIFKQIAKPFKQFSALFSLISITAKKRSLESTNIFYEELKRAKYLMFLQHYQPISQKNLVLPEHASVKYLKTKVKEIKADLNLNKDSLNNLKYLANCAFLESVSQKIAMNSDLVKTHFKISIKKTDNNFFPQLEQITGHLKAASAVKNIKNRLSQKTTADKGAIVQKGIALSITFIEAMQGLGFACAPLLPVVTTFSGVAAVACGIHTYQEFKNSARFKESMIRLTTS